MRVVVHAGMHKTGSSAIQQYFSGLKDDKIVYPRWTDSNLCGLFVLLFYDEDKLHLYHGFKARGQEFIETLPSMKERWLTSLEEDIERSRGKTLLFSAEDISAPGLRSAVVRMQAFFARWTSEITVVGYARSPTSFALSAFQQMLKDGGINKLNVETLWPHYRPRFEMLEEIFGKENVNLRAYDVAHLQGGDVVRDFATILGVDVNNAPLLQANTSLSAEATALLFAQRRLGDGFVSGFLGAQAGNNTFVDKLKTIGSSRMIFSEDLWRPVLQSHSEDLKWIEERLGRRFDDMNLDDAIVVGSEDDLMQLAMKSYGVLENLLIDSIKSNRRPPLPRVVMALDMLRLLSYAHGPKKNAN